MTQLCELTQVGVVGKVRNVGPNVAITIASDASFKNGEGQWVKRSHWNEHTIFARQTGVKKWAEETLAPGDLVCIRSTPFQTERTTDGGEKVYGVTNAVLEVALLCAKSDRTSKTEEQPAQTKKRLR